MILRNKHLEKLGKTWKKHKAVIDRYTTAATDAQSLQNNLCQQVVNLKELQNVVFTVSKCKKAC